MIELIFAAIVFLIGVGLVILGADRFSPMCCACEKKIHIWQGCRVIAMSNEGFAGMYAHTKCMPYRHWIGHRLWEKMKVKAWQFKTAFEHVLAPFKRGAKDSMGTKDEKLAM